MTAQGRSERLGPVERVLGEGLRFTRTGCRNAVRFRGDVGRRGPSERPARVSIRRMETLVEMLGVAALTSIAPSFLLPSASRLHAGFTDG